MKFIMKHEIRGRIRVHMSVSSMTFAQADLLEYYLGTIEGVTAAKVYERTCDAVINYLESPAGKAESACRSKDFKGGIVRSRVLTALADFRYENVEPPRGLIENSGRETNALYQEKLAAKVLWRYGKKFFLPASLRAVLTTVSAVKYVFLGIRCLLKGKIEVPVLDAAAIGVSVLRGDYDTAGSVMFLLGVGELLEEWTHKKSVDDLARTMALNVGKVWLKTTDNEILVDVSQINPGDCIVVRMGNLIPFDGIVAEGEAMINQAALTGESVPVRKLSENAVFAGTVVEEGEITIRVTGVGGNSRYDRIVQMIEESEKLKSGLESRAEHLADRLVPYTFLGTGLVYLFTRNVTKTLSVLMVDFSCALKLAMPISVLSAIRDAGKKKITVKGGKFLEAVADADTIVFDKTGTLTKAKPIVNRVVSFNGEDENELLRLAACMEEHFPHSMANAVVDAAKRRNLIHEERHSKVEYIVAHGIATTIEGKRAVIGSYHFVFEDENCVLPTGTEEKFAALPDEYSHLYMAVDGVLAAVICIEDPLREEARDVVKALKEAGFSKVVMMTGDSERTAKAIALKTGVDEYYSEVLPEDKAAYVEKEKQNGRKVVMVGDGINDSPALSAADAGIAISEGAEIAREVADITIGEDDLSRVVTLKKISDALMKRIRKNYRTIVGFNSGLIALGVAGVIQPATSALLHNTSTIVIGVGSMRELLEE